MWYSRSSKNFNSLSSFLIKLLDIYCTYTTLCNILLDIIKIMCNKNNVQQELIKGKLLSDIDKKIKEFVKSSELDGVKSLEKYNPEKAAKILFLSSSGKTQTQLVRKYGFKRDTIVRVLSTYADHLGKWKDLGGQLASYSYLNISSLEEDMVQEVRSSMESGELKPTFKDIKDISIAKANSAREALLARGEATSINREEKVYTDEDYRELMEKAKSKMKEAQIIDLEDER